MLSRDSSPTPVLPGVDVLARPDELPLQLPPWRPEAGLGVEISNVGLLLEPKAGPPVTLGDVARDSKISVTPADAAKVNKAVVEPIIEANKDLVQKAKTDRLAGALPRDEAIKSLESQVSEMHRKACDAVGFESKAENTVEKLRELQILLWKSGYVLTAGIKTLGNDDKGQPVARVVFQLMELDKKEPERAVTIPPVGGMPGGTVRVGNVTQYVANDPSLGDAANMATLGASTKPSLGYGYAVRFKDVWHVDYKEFERQKVVTGKALETLRVQTDNSTFANEAGHALLYAQYPTLFGPRTNELEARTLVKYGGKDYTVRQCNELWSDIVSMACQPKENTIGIAYSLTFADPSKVPGYALCNQFVSEGVHAAAAARGWATDTPNQRLAVYYQLFTNAEFRKEANEKTYKAAETFFRETVKPALDEMEKKESSR